jgi:hypothetical protein
VNDLLEQCRTCGGRVSRAARACPHCGEPRPAARPDERSPLVTLLLALLVAGIAIAILSVVWQ